MCGIAGAVSSDGSEPVDLPTLDRMLTLLAHRGPEVAGTWTGHGVALGHARLSIVDLDNGLQPLTNEDGTCWLAVNGEVYNHVELRTQLQSAGHRFRTRSDSEVILHLYEDHGTALLDVLNGQYAFAMWDGRRRRLLLGRDRLGVRPLFYAFAGGTMVFSSEVKALLAHPGIERRPDLRSLEQVFTYWSSLPGRTVFEGVREVPAGHFLVFDRDEPEPVARRYWGLRFDHTTARSGDDHAAELREALVDATRLRLRADVPVGAYLSGGLDSSAVAAIASRLTPHRLQTFSVAFEEGAFDERPFQEQVARALGTDHHVIECRHRDIADVFPDVIWHSETPILRTAPAPLFLLSSLVRANGLKVVLTGEGADEVLAGYDIFKEALVRRFWARRPESRQRPLLLLRLYGWLPELSQAPQATLEAFFRRGLTDTDDPAYSHLVRWGHRDRFVRLLSPEARAVLRGYESRRELDDLLEPGMAGWDSLSRAQYLEVLTFLTPYLLSSQGDRMAMAHSVEERFPFLDHRLVELATRIPPHQRIVGLHEKAVLKRAMADLVPDAVRKRPKQPYRAPIAAAFCGPDAPPYVGELLGPDAVRDAGLLDPGAVSRLLAKCRARPHLSESDGMALVGVLSTQLWHSQFISAAPMTPPTRTDIVRLGIDAPAPALA